MSPEARQELATRQAELVQALLGRGAWPDGFDVDRLHATAAALTTKRLRAAARAWPTLAESLGRRYENLFREFATTTKMPDSGGPVLDGRAFARWLACRNELPESGRLQALAFDLRFAQTAVGSLHRRRIAVKTCLLCNPRRLVVGLRLPWLGERWLTIPLGRQFQKKETV